MRLRVNRSKLSGRVAMPASKSHTIRALVIAGLADGESRLIAPLHSADTSSAVRAARMIGAQVAADGDDLIVTGVAGNPQAPAEVIDVGNSGVTLRTVCAAAALADGTTRFTGDEQIQTRPLGPLLEALNQLGAEAGAERGNGCAPVRITGPMRGGSCTIECPTSQYLSALLISCPLAAGDTHIDVTLLNEEPFVLLTLDWLDRQGIAYEAEGLRHFDIAGEQGYTGFERAIPADFSSAAFFLCAAAITGAEITLTGLDMDDSQGDKAIVEQLRQMGAEIEVRGTEMTVRGGELHGCELDLNATPDALPILAVVGCFAEGETVLGNVPQARIKETDRISVMAAELGKMGAHVEELPDGLIVRRSDLLGAEVEGHSDHRVVMALAVAGMAATGETVVSTAESVAVTFPDFVELMQQLGATLEKVDTP